MDAVNRILLLGGMGEETRLHAARSLRWHADLVRSFYPGWDESRARELYLVNKDAYTDPVEVRALARSPAECKGHPPQRRS